MVDATVSKTVGGQLPCRFDPDLRHSPSEKLNTWSVSLKMMPSCVVVAQGTLDPLAQVRVLARQLSFFVVSYQAVLLGRAVQIPR